MLKRMQNTQCSEDSDKNLHQNTSNLTQSSKPIHHSCFSFTKVPNLREINKLLLYYIINLLYPRWVLTLYAYHCNQINCKVALSFFFLPLNYAFLTGNAWMVFMSQQNQGAARHYVFIPNACSPNACSPNACFPTSTQDDRYPDQYIEMTFIPTSTQDFIIQFY